MYEDDVFAVIYFNRFHSSAWTVKLYEYKVTGLAGLRINVNDLSCCGVTL